MPFDQFSLENTLRLTSKNFLANHGDWMKEASVHAAAICQTLGTRFHVRTSFLGGSMARQTFGAPRYEIDLFVVLDDLHQASLAAPPSMLINQFDTLLRGMHYFNRRNGYKGVGIRVVHETDHAPEEPVRIIVLPVFQAPRGFSIPDQWADRWIYVDPDKLDCMAQSADRKSSNWRALTRLVKTWNNRGEKFEPFIKPALLIEVMTIDFAQDLSGSDFGTQLVGLYQMLYRRFDEEWPDPAGVGPSLTSYMTPNRRKYARQHLEHAWLKLAEAKRADNGGNYREAKQLARSVLGKMVSTEPRYEDGGFIPIKPFSKRF